MYRIARPTRFVAAIFMLSLLAACGHRGSATADGPFCGAMEQVSGLLGRNTGSQTPQANEARYKKLPILLATARTSAPTKIADDIATFAVAIDNFDKGLAAVGYDLDAFFATSGGTKLADDTSHALTPSVVNYLQGPCGLKLG